jgi:hypothetical protein
VLLQLHSAGDIDLEQWAAERAGDAFRQVFNRTISLAKVRE